MNDAAIELRGIVKSYGTKHVLAGLDLAVPKGSVLGLLGTNGAGKTTLIKCASGLIRPHQGEARLLGEDSWNLSAEAKARIGYVPQVVNLYPWMKVRHIIDYTATFYPNWNHELVARLTRRMGHSTRGSHRSAFGRPATEGGDPAGVGTQPRSAHFGRTGREP